MNSKLETQGSDKNGPFQVDFGSHYFWDIPKLLIEKEPRSTIAPRAGSRLSHHSMNPSLLASAQCGALPHGRMHSNNMVEWIPKYQIF